jgi:aspartate kinase
MSRPIVVVKIGGSVLTGRDGYRRAAEFLAGRIASDPRNAIVAVVSAELGVTDALLATARDFVEAPDTSALDLLWSTGELRSAALLTLALQARGVSALGVNIHQAGIVKADDTGQAQIRGLRLRAVLGCHDVVVAPGFLARERGDGIVSLGRGGSDLTAVLLAVGLGAVRCELLKDVPGYFTSDPKLEPGALPIPLLGYDRALQMADEGCDLVQRNALVAARDHGVELIIAAIGGGPGSVITTHNVHFESAVA